ncbi:MAG: hypothetical protein ABFS56_06385 [Pseudomonadota bacterium]
MSANVACENHFQANRLSISEMGGTALACYKEVLEKEPSNAEALAGLDKIAARYVTWTKEALDRGQKDEAKRYFENLRQVNPELPILAALEERIYSKPLPITPSQVDTSPSEETPSPSNSSNLGQNRHFGCLSSRHLTARL